jgi:hypothetical protein
LVDVVKWALYYEDGSKYTDLDGPAEESPRFGVVGILQSHYQGTLTFFADWFGWYRGRWWPHDHVGLLKRTTELPVLSRQGEMVDETDFLAITTRMMADKPKVKLDG